MNSDELASEDAALRAALGPIPASEMPPDLEARILAQLPKRRRRFRPAWLLVPAALAAAVFFAVLLLQSPPPAPSDSKAPRSTEVAAGPLRFDAGPRCLSLPDGSSLVLGQGTDAEFREVPGARGLVRLREGEIFCKAELGPTDLLVEAPGLRARTREAQFVATTKLANQKETPSMNMQAASAAAMLYVLSGNVIVDEGPKPALAALGSSTCPAAHDKSNDQSDCSRCHAVSGVREVASDSRIVLAMRGGSTEGVTIATPAAVCTLRGRVVDVRGRAIVAAQVRVHRGDDNVLATITTGEDGSYEATDLASGDVTLAVTAAGYLAGSTSATASGSEPIEVAPIALEEERHVRGRIVDRFGSPVAGARIGVARESREDETTPIARYRHTLAALSLAKQRTFVQRLDSQVKVTSRLLLAGKPCVQLDLDPNLRFEARGGVRVETGLKLLGAERGVAGPTPPARGFYQVSFSGADTVVLLGDRSGATSDENGQFDIGGLEDGTYTLSASLPDWIEVSAPPSVSAGTEDVVIVLARGGEIRGTVFGPDGKPVAGARVNDVVTDAQGRYRIAGLPGGSVDLYAGPGEMRQIFVYASSDGGSDSTQAWTKASVLFEDEVRPSVSIQAREISFTHEGREDAPAAGLAQRRGVAVHEGEVLEHVDFQLPPARTIEGVVVDDLGQPVAGASVEFRPDEEVPYFGGDRAASSDASGVFRIEAVFDVAGRIEASSDAHLGDDPKPIGPAGSVSELRVVLPRAATIHGTIATSATLVLHDLDREGTKPLEREIAPGSDDVPEFRLDRLKPGRYRLEVVPSEGQRLDLGLLTLTPGETAELGEIVLPDLPR